jgi:hypothetical protein
MYLGYVPLLLENCIYFLHHKLPIFNQGTKIFLTDKNAFI